MAKKKKKDSNLLNVKNATKTLYANIRFMSPDEPIKTMLVTSAVPNEGKTTTSVHLAQAIATSGKTVVLVDADMRRGSVAGILRIQPKAGAYAVMSESATLLEAVTKTSVPNLYFLDIEPNIPNPVDLLISKKYLQLVEDLKSKFDYVIFDTPPTGTFVDAAVLSTLVDGVVLVARSNFVKRTEVVNAFEQLNKANANILGVCATFCEDESSEYYYAYYNQRGSRVESSRTARRKNR